MLRVRLVLRVREILRGQGVLRVQEVLRAERGVKGWIDETRLQNSPGASQSLPELHRHRGVSHPCPPQPRRLPPVLCLV